jgi:alpha-ribazole phosphatase/probable phosphoglycerate mutase
MHKVWENIKPEVTHIFSSPLSRCAEPALAWAKEADLSCNIDQRLKELSYGGWEGLTAAEIEQQFPGMLAAWREDPTHMTPPNGESMLDFAARTSSFLDDLLAEYGSGYILIVAHSGTIRLLLAHALGAPIESTRHLNMPYACWSRLQVSDEKLTLAFHHRIME